MLFYLRCAEFPKGQKCQLKWKIITVTSHSPISMTTSRGKFNRMRNRNHMFKSERKFEKRDRVSLRKAWGSENSRTCTSPRGSMGNRSINKECRKQRKRLTETKKSWLKWIFKKIWQNTKCRPQSSFVRTPLCHRLCVCLCVNQWRLERWGGCRVTWHSASPDFPSPAFTVWRLRPFCRAFAAPATERAPTSTAVWVGGRFGCSNARKLRLVPLRPPRPETG